MFLKLGKVPWETRNGSSVTSQRIPLYFQECNRLINFKWINDDTVLSDSFGWRPSRWAWKWQIVLWRRISLWIIIRQSWHSLTQSIACLIYINYTVLTLHLFRPIAKRCSWILTRALRSSRIGVSAVGSVLHVWRLMQHYQRWTDRHFRCCCQMPSPGVFLRTDRN